jgi:lipoprotein-anchoring transpeptidase ErfK/SrfK
MAMRRISAPLGATLAAVVLALVAGCGGGSAEVGDTSAVGDAPSTGADHPTGPSEPTSPGATTGASTATDATSQVARTGVELAVFSVPGGEQTMILPATTDFGSPRALLVVAEDGDWLQVALPVRPNGSTGWVRRADVELRTLDEAVVIDLAARTLTLLDGDAEVLTTPVAVGAADNPTPSGTFYVVDKLDTGDPDGPYGEFALGLSAHSDTLTEFAGGAGQVGIHGTNEPSSIGQAVSHGCVRVPGDVARRLAETVNLGTPVVIS